MKLLASRALFVVVRVDCVEQADLLRAGDHPSPLGGFIAVRPPTIRGETHHSTTFRSHPYRSRLTTPQSLSGVRRLDDRCHFIILLGVREA